MSCGSRISRSCVSRSESQPPMPLAAPAMTGYPGPVHRWRPGHAMTNSGARAAQPPAGGAALAGRLAAGRGQSQDSCTQAATQSRVQVRTKALPARDVSLTPCASSLSIARLVVVLVCILYMQQKQLQGRVFAQDSARVLGGRQTIPGFGLPVLFPYR